mmetsp:Transcript_91962/g.297588  ORF Transcript_91962/g.297588 Transcript_91962/m.297588 type:complete len:291 (+) Transcript_91962:72-944(+)
MAEVEVQKRIRNLRKKLGQIAKLKEKDELSAEESQKVATEPALLAEVTALEKGEEFVPEPVPPPAAAPAEAACDGAGDGAEEAGGGGGDEAGPPEPPEKPALPALEPAEAEKRIKALKKKLGQITKLKERGGNFTPEEAEKVASEGAFVAEVMELEISLLEPEAQKTAKALRKELDLIRKTKEKKGQLSPQERGKVAKGPELKKELDALLAARPVYSQPAASNGASKKAPTAKAAPAAPLPREEEGGLDPSEYAMISQALQEEDDVQEDGFVQKSSRKQKQKQKAAATEE